MDERISTGMQARIRFFPLFVANVALLLLAGAEALGQQEHAPPLRLVCEPAPAEPEAGVACPMGQSASGGKFTPVGSTDPRAPTQLQEAILQQRETIINQKEVIKELTAKLSGCEGGPAGGASGGQGAVRPARMKGLARPPVKETMGDPPGASTDHLARSLLALSQRMEILEQQQENVSERPVNVAGLQALLSEHVERLGARLLARVQAHLTGQLRAHNETVAQRAMLEAQFADLARKVSELERGVSGLNPPGEFKLSLPLRTNYMCGRFEETLPELYAVTMCMWLRAAPGAAGLGTPFSYAVPGQANELVLIEWGNHPMEFLVNDKVAQLPLSVNDGGWHHVCITWTTRDGVWEAFQDGVRRGVGEGLAPWHPIKPGGVLILGQEQDTVGGRFDATQAFVGELAYFNLWDRVLAPAEMASMWNCSSNPSGNILSWTSEMVQVVGGAAMRPLEPCPERVYL
ncbi:neuronal pentraxin-2-like [Lampetra fluviatilis]